jgi:hypothetical protein
VLAHEVPAHDASLAHFMTGGLTPNVFEENDQNEI